MGKRIPSGNSRGDTGSGICSVIALALLGGAAVIAAVADHVIRYLA